MPSSKNPHSKPEKAISPSSFRVLIDRAKSSDFISKILNTLSTRVLIIALGFVTSVVIARTLGPEGRGMFAMAMTIGILGTQLTNLGLHGANTYYVARDTNLLHALLGNSLIVSFTLGTVISLLAGLFFWAYPSLAPIHGVLLLMALTWAPLGLAYLLLQNLLLGVDDVRAYNRIELTTKLFYFGLLGVIILFNQVTPEIVFSGALIALFIRFAWSYFSLSARINHAVSCSINLFRKSMRYGVKSYFGSLFSLFLFKIDLLMINNMLGTKEAGYYDIAINLAQIVFILPEIVSIILFPKLCAIETTIEKWKIARQTGYWLAGIMLVICGLAALFAKPAIEILFGSPFLPSLLPLLILIICKYILALNLIFNNFIVSIHIPWTSIPFSFCLVILNIFLNLTMIERYGMAGAAWATTISFGILILFNMFYSYKYLFSNKVPDA
jgi:O-antigen/teichoic acid export membrane protein